MRWVFLGSNNCADVEAPSFRMAYLCLSKQLEEEGSWRLLKGPDPVEIEEDAEVQIKVLVGKTGHKHHMLPDWASLGYVWVVPSFEGPGPEAAVEEEEKSRDGKQKQKQKWTMEFGAHDIDFRKSGLEGLTVNMSWMS